MSEVGFALTTRSRVYTRLAAENTITANIIITVHLCRTWWIALTIGNQIIIFVLTFIYKWVMDASSIIQLYVRTTFTHTVITLKDIIFCAVETSCCPRAWKAVYFALRTSKCNLVVIISNRAVVNAELLQGGTVIEYVFRILAQTIIINLRETYNTCDTFNVSALCTTRFTRFTKFM